MTKLLYNKIKEFFGLSLAIAKAEFKLKNEGTWLGILWYLLAPIFTFLVMVGIFQDRLGQEIPNYPLYLLLGIIMFNFFRNITTESVSKIKQKAGLIKSLNFSREAIIGSVVLKTLFSHLFELIILVIFLLIFNMSPFMMLYYPIVLLLLTLFSFGAALILSSLFVYFFDLENIWGFGVQLIWFATPVFYQIGGQDKLFLFNLFNPMYYLIELGRELIIYNRMPETWIIVGCISYSVTALIIGLVIFNILKKRFAEMV